MAADEVKRLDLKDLDAVLEQAKAEGWTELALVGPASWPIGEASPVRPVISAEEQARRLVSAGWSAGRIFLLTQPLDHLPRMLTTLTSLKSLDLWGNGIGKAGAKAIASLASLASLSSLTALGLGYSDIGEAEAKAIGKLPLSGLTALDLGGNLIGKEGAKAIAGLSGLTTLDLRFNFIGDEEATAIAGLSGLTSLDLTDNRIGDEGAESIARLAALTRLDLQNNDIGPRGAKSLSKLTRLTSLNLDWGGVLDEGARWLAKLENLVSLSLAMNGLGDDGIEALRSLPKLKSLNLRGNVFGDRGAAVLAQSSTLTRLNITECTDQSSVFRTILDGWAFSDNWQDREYLRLTDWRRDGDPIEGYPSELIGQSDAQALIAAWRRFREAEEKGELRPLNEAKVLVLGNEAVGKTSLVRYLIDGRPRVEDEKKTAGIVIRRDVSIEDWSAEKSAVRLHFWDFGGQEIMRQTHRLFLTRRSLYLVVLTNREEDDRSVYDWLKVIQSRGGESPVLVVINKCDEGAPNLRLDETGIRAAYPIVVGFLAVSCNADSEERIAELRQQIAKLVERDPRLKHVRDPFPPEHLRVKKAVAAAAEESRYLERAAFVRLCETADEPGLQITDPALQRSLLQLLHDLGTVVAHGLERERSDAAREVTLLDPNWLTEAIYRLLNSKRILDQGGVFDRNDMAAELDPERYPPERHGYIVDMMQEAEIGLCFRLPGQDERWLMPECLPTVGPDVEGFFANALRFRFSYELLPIGLVPRLIVEAYNKFTDQPTRWRTGALLAAAGCKVLVRADLDKNRIDLAVTGPEGRRRSALEAVLHDLEAVHKLNPEIGMEARVPLPDDPKVDVGYEHLLALEADEGPEHRFRPEKAKRKYTVGELLAGVPTDRVARVMPEPVVPLVEPSPSQGLAGHWWFPLACGAAAMALVVLLMFLPTNESRAIVGGVLGVGIAVTLVATHLAPGRYYRRMLTWVVAAGFLIHAAGFSAEAGFWGDAAAHLQWDGRVSGWFSVAWLVTVLAFIVADLRQASK